MALDKKIILSKVSPSERHPYGSEKKKYRKIRNRRGRQLLKRFFDKIMRQEGEI